MNVESETGEDSGRVDRLARRRQRRYVSQEEAERDSESVQRVIISSLLGVVVGSIAVVLAVYVAVWGARDLAPSEVIGMWLMTGVIGLITAVAVLVIQQRRPYSPWALLGLLPMAISAFWIFG